MENIFYYSFLFKIKKGELIALPWNDIDFKNNKLIIDKTLYDNVKGNYTITSTKNNQNRKVKMNRILKENLYLYKEKIQQYIDFKGSWFVFGSTRHLPNTTIDRNKHNYFVLSGVHEITIHEFRHSHVSLLINEYIKSGQTDTTKFFIMMFDRMGHTIDVMQETYLHLFPTIQTEIVNLLDNL